jgi:flagellar protein FlgJ
MAPLSASDAALAAGVSPAQVAKLRQAAQDFEAMALGQLLQPMFSTVDMAHGVFGGGAGEAAVQPMLVDALAKNIAAHGGLGLAAPVFASMLRSQEAANQGAPRGRHGGTHGGTQGGKQEGTR